jgi:hypothetical protein
MINKDKHKDSMITLSLDTLDITELERRIELAVVAAPKSWCSQDECNLNCFTVCTLEGAP